MLGIRLITKIPRQQNGKMFASSTPKLVDDTRVPPDLTKSLPAFSKDDYAVMVKHFPGIVDDLTTGQDYSKIPDFIERITRLLYYTVPNGKKVRGLTTLITYRMLEKPENITEERLKLASILGWCVELLEASGLIVDDILDKSDTRRNLPCWYKLSDVGDVAILDSFLLENCIQLLLKKHFSSHPNYVPISDLFTSTNFMMIIGQMLDCHKYKLDQVTMEMYSIIVKYKTESYTFTFAVTLGMHLSKVYNEDLYRQVQPILKEMGRYFQIKNDYYDCFSDPGVTGKNGTDIQEGRCTWLAARALQKANSTQYKIMAKHFGKPEAESVKAVIDLYKELNIPGEVQIYGEQSFERLSNQIKNVSHKSLANLLFSILERLYKRQRV